MPPKKDPKQLKGQKQGTLIKDLIPVSIKQPPRDPRAIKHPEPNPIEKKQEFKSFQPPPEWPGDDQAKIFDFGIENSIKFVDNTKIKTPSSFSQASSQLTFWRRPKEFLLDEIESLNEDFEIESSKRRGSGIIEPKPAQKSKFRTMGTISFSGEKKGMDGDQTLKIEDDIRVHSPKKRENDIVVSIKVTFFLNEYKIKHKFIRFSD